MSFNDIAYLLFLSVMLCISYFAIIPFQRYFFQNSGKHQLQSGWQWSIVLILFTSLLVYAISFAIPNIEIGNRIIHAFGGGFLAYLVCFLAARDASLKTDKIRFFIFSFMLVMTLGIVNEIVEFFLQNMFNFLAAPNINDTWYDLMSNFFGAALAGLIFTPKLK